MLFLNWRQFSAKGCFTVPFAASVAGRGVSKSHIYIPLHCLWAQSSKEMHNAGRLMTWNGPHESILINWSTKDLPWKESPPEMSQLLIYTLNTKRSQDSEWAARAAVRRRRETSFLWAWPSSNLPAPLTSLHFSFHPRISLPHRPKLLPPLRTLMTPAGIAPSGTSPQPTGMPQAAAASPRYPDIGRQPATALHLQILSAFH